MYLATLYWLIPAFCFFADNIKFIKHNKFLKYIFIGIIVFFTCFSYVTGSDWWAYEIRFTGDFNEFEPLYSFIANQSYHLGLNFWYFSSILKIICFIIIIKLLSHLVNSKNDIWFCYGLLFCNKLFVMFMAPILRNLVAVSILWYAFYLQKHNKHMLALCFCLLSIGFHKSAIIILLLCLLSKCLYYISSRLIILFFVLGFSIAPFIGNIVNTIILSFFSNTGIVYLSQKGNYGGLMILFLPIISTIFLFISNKNLIQDMKYGKDVYNYSVVSILLIPFIMHIGVMYRVKMFFDLFWATGIIFLLKRMKFAKLFKAIIAIVIIIDSYSLLNFELIIRDEYIPYTNYIIDDIPSKDKRNYTKNNSPINNIINEFKSL